MSDIPGSPSSPRLENKYAQRTLVLTNRCVIHSGPLSPAIHQLIAKLVGVLSSRSMPVLRKLIADPNVAKDHAKSKLVWALTEAIGDLNLSLGGTLYSTRDPYYPRFVEQSCLGMSSV
jgi:hypothetical protein